MRKICITMGEPGGIGPETALKAAVKCSGICIPVLVGDMRVFKQAADMLGIKRRLKGIESIKYYDSRFINIIDIGGFGYEKGMPTKGGGKASYESIKSAVEIVMANEAHALVTSPISKEALKLAGYKWPGHTELLAEITKTKRYAMMLSGRDKSGKLLKVMLVTIHYPLSKVPGLIDKRTVLKTIGLAYEACRMFSINAPRIAVCGLNPHAGESGLFGAEEARHIAPAIKEAKAKGMDASGPYPADTVFFRALRGDFDIVVSMYHDQGLAPLKLIAFDTGVNITVGLPVIRTSPDHGTAYDIAWKGKADPKSTVEAIKTALTIKI